MQKSLLPLLLSFFGAMFTLNFIIPFLSLSIFEYYGQSALIIAAIIFCTPQIAQSSTFHIFTKLAYKYKKEKVFIFIGYSAALIQALSLYFLSKAQNPVLSLTIVFIGNLFIVAYIPAVKTYIAQLNPAAKGKALSQLNIIQTSAFGSGTLLGGFCYEWIGIHQMILISVIVCLITLVIAVKIPSMYQQDVTIKNGEQIHIQEEPSLNGSSQTENRIHNSIFTRKSALYYQFFLTAISALFFAIYAIYLNTLGTPAWFYGMSNMGAAICGALLFGIFGIILDRYGPDSLYWWGWISYALFYLVLLLSTNLILIFIIWMWPAYPFYMATEYIACQEKNREKANLNMAGANFSRSFGVVVGQILGGILASFTSFRIVMVVAFIGCICMGIVIFVLTRINRLTHPHKQLHDINH